MTDQPAIKRGLLRRHPLLSVFTALSGILIFYLTYLTLSLPAVDFLRSKNPNTTSLMTARASEARANRSVYSTGSP